MKQQTSKRELFLGLALLFGLSAIYSMVLDFIIGAIFEIGYWAIRKIGKLFA